MIGMIGGKWFGFCCVSPSMVFVGDLARTTSIYGNLPGESNLVILLMLPPSELSSLFDTKSGLISKS
jgi:hypothetical protein